MRTSATARWSRWFVFAALLVAVAIFTAACGSSGNKGSSATTGGGGTTAKPVLTDSFRGVTKDAIKVGIVIIDYKCIAQFVDFNRGDQKATYEVFVKDINDHGGILGRKLVPVYKTYCPIQESESLQLCASLTDDENVFAVIGVFVNASNSGASQLCVSRDHQTILISHEMEQAWIDQSPPGLMLTSDITAERRLKVLISLLKSEKTLENKTVAVLTDANSKRRVDEVIAPALGGMGIKDQGSTAVLTISGTDTSQAQNQLDSFIERWKGEKVDTLILGGPNVSTDQFINKIGAALPGVLLVVDQPSAALQAARKATDDKVTPNPYKNVISVEGENGKEHFTFPLEKHCIDLFEKATGKKVLVPGTEPLVAGHKAELYTAQADACSELSFFATIAKKVGANLTNDTWTKTVDSFGAIESPSTRYASLHKGKYDADDAFRLVQYDETLKDWKGLTPLKNVSGD